MTQYFRQKDDQAAEEEILQDVLNQNQFKSERTKIENWYARHHDSGSKIMHIDAIKPLVNSHAIKNTVLKYRMLLLYICRPTYAISILLHFVSAYLK